MLPQLDKNQQPALIAVKRDNGDCTNIVINEIPQKNNTRSSQWCLIEDDMLPGKIYSDLDELARYIESSMIPIIGSNRQQGINPTMQTIQSLTDMDQA
jgi:hypothetical protein